METAFALGGSRGSAAGSSASGGPRGDLVGRRRRRRRGHAEHRSFEVPFSVGVDDGSRTRTREPPNARKP